MVISFVVNLSSLGSLQGMPFIAWVMCLSVSCLTTGCLFVVTQLTAWIRCSSCLTTHQTHPYMSFSAFNLKIEAPVFWGIIGVLTCTWRSGVRAGVLMIHGPEPIVRTQCTSSVVWWSCYRVSLKYGQLWVLTSSCRLGRVRPTYNFVTK